MRSLSIFDTTLRDGEQAPGNSMTPAQKVLLGKRLERLGVDVIEAGFAASSADDYKAVSELAKALERATICVFARPTRVDIDAAVSALGSYPKKQLQILAVGSDIHLEHKRRISREAAIAEAVEGIRYARSTGVDDLTLGVEDATRGAFDYLRALARAALDAGARTITLADTVGSCLPHEYAALVSRFKAAFGDELRISIHVHNDMGLALANALAGVEAGADEVQTTLGGIGERAGNTALEELVCTLHSKAEHFGVETRVDESQLYDAAKLLFDTLKIPIANHKPIVGEHVFSTEAGIHQAGILRDPRTYEYLHPERFGRERRLVLGKHSGRTLLAHRLREAGIEVERVVLDRVYEALIQNGGASSPAPAEIVAAYERCRSDVGVG